MLVSANALNDILETTLPASVEAAESFIMTLREFLSKRHLETLVFDLELLAREALVNAVRHGCQGDPLRSINVQLTVLKDRVRLCVSDDGPGFDWRNASSALPSLTSETGRGRFIMNTYADAVEFNDLGNTVCVTKTLPVEEGQMSMDTEGLVQIPLETIVSAKNVQDLREKFKEHVQRGARLMELDFSRVESIDSVGIGLLVATHNSLVKVGGNLSLVNLSQDIHKLLTLMRLDKHFSVSQAAGGGSHGTGS